MKTIEFHYDFGSPNAYLSHAVLPQIEKRTGVTFTYVPVLLGGIFKATNNVSPVIAVQGVKNKGDYLVHDMHRFADKHNIAAFGRNPHFPVNTLTIMRGAIVAEQEGYGAKYINEVFDHMWGQKLKMDDPEVIVEALNASGFDGAHILVRTQEPEVKKALIDNTNASVERGAFGLPTFFVGDEMFFGKDSLHDVEDEILK